MKNKILACLSFGLLCVGCGKSNTTTYSPAPSFEMGAMDLTPTDGANTPAIKRADLEAGPGFKLTGMSPDITKIDKALICGPVTVVSRTAPTTDPHAFAFKVSDMEFPGLNQLPINPHCILQVTASNAAGSDFTKKTPLVLKFDSQALVKISRAHMERGFNPIINGEVLLEQYVIQNTQRFPVTFLYQPINYGGTGTCIWESNRTRGGLRGSILLTSPERIAFDPPTVIPTGDRSTGLHFTVPGEQTVTVTVSNRAPSDCSQTKSLPEFAYPNGLISVGTAMTFFVYEIHQPAPTLFQQRDFAPTDDDLLHPEAVLPTSDGPFANTHHDDFSTDIMLAWPVQWHP